LTESLLEDTEGVEEWGQNEPLTRRIKNLLKDYTDGFSVPKEILISFNADARYLVCGSNITIWSPDIRLGTCVRLYTAQNPRPNLPIFAASDSFVAPLTRRIKNLLKDYTDGFSVPKEIVQNADDAGATKVCFMYDERQNKECRNRLIHENMAECQGRLISFNADARYLVCGSNITIWSPDIRLGTSVRLYTAQNPRPNLPIFAASDSVSTLSKCVWV
jgi:hypothetical protein